MSQNILIIGAVQVISRAGRKYESSRLPQKNLEDLNKVRKHKLRLSQKFLLTKSSHQKESSMFFRKCIISIDSGQYHVVIDDF